jgi:SAM-dependent methyltransferase
MVNSIEIALPEARRVLDFGCGTGWVIGGARAASAPLRVGVDISKDALGEGKRLGEPVHFVAGDGCRLPFAAEAFDVVVGHVSLPYMPTENALREIYRVLAPGGSFFFTVHSFQYIPWHLGEVFPHAPWGARLKTVLYLGYIALNGVLTHWGLPQLRFLWTGRFETVHTAAGFCRAARRAGFVLLSAEREYRRIFFAVTGRKPDGAAGRVSAAPAWAIYRGLK